MKVLPVKKVAGYFVQDLQDLYVGYFESTRKVPENKPDGEQNKINYTKLKYTRFLRYFLANRLNL